MKVITGAGFDGFCSFVKSYGRKVICFGAGLVALSVEDIFEGAGLSVHCFIDNDGTKHGASVRLWGKDIPIWGTAELLDMTLDDKVLLITAEAFGEIVENLNVNAGLAELPCYIFPELNRDFALKSAKDRYTGPAAGGAKIPRVIHYSWLGGNEMPEEFQVYIKTWKTHNPAWDIVRWDEDNYDVYQTRYMREAYQTGKYAFAADWLRLDVLYRHGGVYLDTDVKVLNSFDKLTRADAFAVYLEWAVPTFAFSGCVEGSGIIKQLRDEPRSGMGFVNPDGTYNGKISSFYELDILRRYGFKGDFRLQTVNGLTMLPPRVFATDGRFGLNADICEHTVAVHYCRRTWGDNARMRGISASDEFVRKIKG